MTVFAQAEKEMQISNILNPCEMKLADYFVNLFVTSLLMTYNVYIKCVYVSLIYKFVVLLCYITYM